jgi:PKD domain
MRRFPMRTHPLRPLALAVLALGMLVVPATASAAPPANDDFANATVITSLPFSNVVDISEATTESGEPLSWWGQSRTVWYSFTPTSDLVVRADLDGSDFVTAFMSVYRADSAGFGGLTKIAGGSYGPPFTFQLQGGTTYYIQEGDDYPWGWVSMVGINLQVVNPPPNDNFADAIAFTSVPFSDSPDLTAATIEPGEPMACGTNFSQSVWYAFTPTTTGGYGGDPGVDSVNVYTGTSLGDLTNVACSQWWGLAFHADAGKTYYLQVYGGGMRIDLLPPPDPSWSYSPGDPSTFDDVSFSHGLGYWDPKITTWVWDFGDGTTETDSNNTATHRFAADGDYNVTLTVGTIDQRTNSQTQTVHVRTHDATILSLVAPDKGKTGKTGVITVGIGNTRYPETVQVDLYKSTTRGYASIGMQSMSVPVMNAKKTVDFSFNYTFTSDDLALGKVTFQAVATIQGARDVLPADNTATSPATLVTK